MISAVALVANRSAIIFCLTESYRRGSHLSRQPSRERARLRAPGHSEGENTLSKIVKSARRSRAGKRRKRLAPARGGFNPSFHAATPATAPTAPVSKTADRDARILRSALLLHPEQFHMLLLRKAEVCAITGLSYTTIYELSKRDKFPRARKVGATNRWLASEVIEWRNALPVRQGKRGTAS